MKPKPYHTIVIGSGAAGLTVAVGLAKLGKTVLLIEKHKVGGDCTNVGCVPSKTLIHLSWRVSDVLSADQILAMVAQRSHRLEAEERAWLLAMPGLTLLFGEAKFLSKDRLEVLDKEGNLSQVTGRRIVIASGARAQTPALPGLPSERYLTNANLFDLTALPSHLAIVGAGAIGCEMAFAFRRLGCRVSLVGPVLAGYEPECSEAILNSLVQAGVEVYVKARANGYQLSSRSLLVTGQDQSFAIPDVEKVLVAAGRRPNLDLDLENVGVRFDHKGIHTDSNGFTGSGKIYALGDVVARSNTTHSANHQGRRLLRHLTLPFLPLGREPHYPRAVFCSPEVAQVGPTLAELRQRMPPELIRTVKVELKDTDRGYTSYLEHGFVQLHAVRLTGRLLSASVVSECAGEMIPLLTLAINQNLTLYRLADLVFPYPTLSDAIKKASDNFVVATLTGLPHETLLYLKHRIFSR